MEPGLLPPLTQTGHALATATLASYNLTSSPVLFEPDHFYDYYDLMWTFSLHWAISRQNG
jgi:hypothetical protein